MKLVNPIYLVAILAGMFLWDFISDYNEHTILFFGFTENKETEINLNHSVEVNQILVTTGQKVKKGDILLEVSHVEFEHDIHQAANKIEELKIKEKIWLANRQGEINILTSEKRLKIDEIQSQIIELKKKQAFNKSLYQDLATIENTTPTYDPLQVKIGGLQKEKTLLENTLNTEIEAQNTELEIGNNPYRQQISSLNAEINLNKNRINKLSIAAPIDGLIGTINCKEAEHISAFKTLLTFYESKPTLIKGYVHENLIVHVDINDVLMVKSSSNPSHICEGFVTGLGSRIVEIPARLRRMPDFKTYGREVLIQIPPDNDFLQKEKVVLFFSEDKEKEVLEDLRKQKTIAKKKNYIYK